MKHTMEAWDGCGDEMQGTVHAISMAKIGTLERLFQEAVDVDTIILAILREVWKAGDTCEPIRTYIMQCKNPWECVHRYGGLRHSIQVGMRRIRPQM